MCIRSGGCRYKVGETWNERSRNYGKHIYRVPAHTSTRSTVLPVRSIIAVSTSGNRSRPLSPVMSFNAPFGVISNSFDLVFRLIWVVLLGHLTEKFIVCFSTSFLCFDQLVSLSRHWYSTVVCHLLVQLVSRLNAITPNTPTHKYLICVTMCLRVSVCVRVCLFCVRSLHRSKRYFYTISLLTNA